MKNAVLSSFFILCISCSYEIIDVLNKALAYEPPDHKFLAAVSRRHIYAAYRETPHTWSKISTPFPLEIIDKKSDSDWGLGDAFNSIAEGSYVENFKDIAFCRGTWAAIAQISPITFLGTAASNAVVVYTNDSQNPLSASEWQRYTIEIGEGPDHDIVPNSIACNELTGEWIIAAYKYFLSSNDAADPTSWKIQATQSFVAVEGVRTYAAKKVFSFLESMYMYVAERIDDYGYLYINVGGAGWERVHLQEELKAKQGNIHSAVFDPISGNVFLGTTQPQIISCKYATLNCLVIPVSTGVDTLATNYRGEFYGSSITNSLIGKPPGHVNFSSSYEGYRAAAPKNVFVSGDPNIVAVTYLDGRWYAGGYLGTLFYTEKEQSPWFRDNHENSRLRECSHVAMESNLYAQANSISIDNCVWKPANLDISAQETFSSNNMEKRNLFFGRSPIVKIISGGF